MYRRLSLRHMTLINQSRPSIHPENLKSYSRVVEWHLVIALSPIVLCVLYFRMPRPVELLRSVKLKCNGVWKTVSVPVMDIPFDLKNFKVDKSPPPVCWIKMHLKQQSVRKKGAKTVRDLSKANTENIRVRANCYAEVELTRQCDMIIDKNKARAVRFPTGILISKYKDGRPELGLIENNLRAYKRFRRNGEKFFHAVKFLRHDILAVKATQAYLASLRKSHSAHSKSKRLSSGERLSKRKKPRQGKEESQSVSEKSGQKNAKMCSQETETVDFPIYISDSTDESEHFTQGSTRNDTRRRSETAEFVVFNISDNSETESCDNWEPMSEADRSPQPHGNIAATGVSTVMVREEIHEDSCNTSEESNQSISRHQSEFQAPEMSATSAVQNTEEVHSVYTSRTILEAQQTKLPVSTCDTNQALLNDSLPSQLRSIRQATCRKHGSSSLCSELLPEQCVDHGVEKTFQTVETLQNACQRSSTCSPQEELVHAINITPTDNDAQVPMWVVLPVLYGRQDGSSLPTADTLMKPKESSHENVFLTENNSHSDVGSLHKQFCPEQANVFIQGDSPQSLQCPIITVAPAESDSPCCVQLISSTFDTPGNRYPQQAEISLCTEQSPQPQQCPIMTLAPVESNSPCSVQSVSSTLGSPGNRCPRQAETSMCTEQSPQPQHYPVTSIPIENRSPGPMLSVHSALDNPGKRCSQQAEVINELLQPQKCPASNDSPCSVRPICPALGRLENRCPQQVETSMQTNIPSYPQQCPVINVRPTDNDNCPSYTPSLCSTFDSVAKQLSSRQPLEASSPALPSPHYEHTNTKTIIQHTKGPIGSVQKPASTQHISNQPDRIQSNVQEVTHPSLSQQTMGPQSIVPQMHRVMQSTDEQPKETSSNEQAVTENTCLQTKPLHIVQGTRSTQPTSKQQINIKTTTQVFLEQATGLPHNVQRSSISTYASGKQANYLQSNLQGAASAQLLGKQPIKPLSSAPGTAYPIFQQADDPFLDPQSDTQVNHQQHVSHRNTVLPPCGVKAARHLPPPFCSNKTTRHLAKMQSPLYSGKPAAPSSSSQPVSSLSQGTPTAAFHNEIGQPTFPTYSQPIKSSSSGQPAELLYNSQLASCLYTDKLRAQLHIGKPTVPSRNGELTVPSNNGQLTLPLCSGQPTTTLSNNQPAGPWYISQPAALSCISQPAAPLYVSQPAALSYISQPAAPVYISQPAAPLYVSQPATLSYISQPAVPVYISQPAAPSYMSQPTAPLRNSQPAAPLYGSEPVAVLGHGEFSTSLYNGQSAALSYNSQYIARSNDDQPLTPSYNNQLAAPSCNGQPATPLCTSPSTAPLCSDQSAAPLYNNQPTVPPNNRQSVTLHSNQSAAPLHKGKLTPLPGSSLKQSAQNLTDEKDVSLDEIRSTSCNTISATLDNTKHIKASGTGSTNITSTATLSALKDAPSLFSHFKLKLGKLHPTTKQNTGVMFQASYIKFLEKNQ